MRINAFRQPGTSRYVLHLLNYNVPLGVEARAAETIAPINLVLRLPGPPTKARVACHDPEAETVEFQAKSEANTLRFTLPALRIYKVVEITSAQ